MFSSTFTPDELINVICTTALYLSFNGNEKIFLKIEVSRFLENQVN